ncbi:MAG: hypothetical protein KDB07_13890, partial [Planctomycetes bacterium]|nr:hypothetical protein [Planctomycetota bacterium]
AKAALASEELREQALVLAPIEESIASQTAYQGDHPIVAKAMLVALLNHNDARADRELRLVRVNIGVRADKIREAKDRVVQAKHLLTTGDFDAARRALEATEEARNFLSPDSIQIEILAPYLDGTRAQIAERRKDSESYPDDLVGLKEGERYWKIALEARAEKNELAEAQALSKALAAYDHAKALQGRFLSWKESALVAPSQATLDQFSSFLVGQSMAAEAQRLLDNARSSSKR